MPNNWNTYKLGDIAEIIMGQSPKGSTTNNNGDGLPLLNGPTEFGYSSPTPTQFTIDPKKLSQKGDVLFCVRGSTTGRMNYANQIYAIGRGIGAFRGKNGYSTKYIKCILDYYLERMLTLCTGSTFPNLSRTDLENFPVLVCKPKEAEAISSILSTIDDKIENNLAMNKTLEDMAMALYKYWFVDFGPFQEGKFKDSELGLIPEGWDVKGLLEIVDLLTGGTPKTKIEEYWNGDIKWVSAKDLGNNGNIYATRTERTITPLGISKSAAKLLPEDSTIIVARGSVGKMGMLSEPMAINQSCFGLYPKQDYSPSIIYLLIQSLVERFQQISYGSVFDTITTSSFSSTNIVCPPKTIVNKMNLSIEPMFKKIKANSIENQTLTKLRDTLLPKLISGEVRLKEFEEEITAVL